MNPDQIRPILEHYQQTHLLAFYDTLSEQEQQALCEQIAALDFSIPVYAASNENTARGTFAPLQGMSIEKAAQFAREHEILGLKALRRGEVGAVLLAGGQGTRLGFDIPKGCVNIGETREVTLFSLHFANLKRHAAMAGRSIPIFIMTSKFNYDATLQFLQEHHYFDYPEEDVILFRQEMAVCTDFDGKALLAAPGYVAESPNGNGGWFLSMEKAGLLPELERRGIRWLNVFAVDNALQQIADPKFIGAVIKSGCESGAKVVAKAAPDERVGVLCLEDGRPSIVEYYEMTDEIRTAREENGLLSYRYGVILNYLFSVSQLMTFRDAQLPIHRAAKTIPCLDAAGNPVSPAQPNGYKYETLVLDMVHFQQSCLPYEIVREAEFAPIKNRNGIDSLDSARILLKNAGFIL